MQIKQLVSAESGWRAVFKEPDEGESLSRIVGWAIVGSGETQQLVGLIVDPSEPARIVPAPEADSPGGGSFLRYRFVAPEPLIAAAPPAPAPAPASDDTPEQLAKSFLKRRR